MRVHQGGYVALSNHLKEFFSKSIFPQGPAEHSPSSGKLLFSHSLFFYLALVLAVVMWWFLYKTRTGLHLRSVGENPATADAAGINVTKFKYLSTIIGGGISAIGGVAYIMTIAGGVWNHEGLSGVGWLAVALVIFCMWRPLSAIWGSIFFGALMILYLRLVIAFIPTQLYKILPYVVTVIVLIISSMRNNKEKQPPASLGLKLPRGYLRPTKKIDLYRGISQPRQERLHPASSRSARNSTARPTKPSTPAICCAIPVW